MDIHMVYNIRWIFCLWLLIGMVLTATVHAKTTEIKIAVVTPKGSAWVKMLEEMVAEVSAQTQGEVAFKVYAGGVSGDESDVLRKMRANRLQAAGMSGVGVGVVLPEIRILEAPLLFQNDREIDSVRDHMFDYFSDALEKKGFVLLGFIEGGWVYLFSKKDLSSENGLKSAKMWVWKGDRVAESFLNAFGVRTTPLHIADVNTGLETGMIDAFYAPPLGALAFQWFTRVAYMLNYPLANSTGALLINKRTFVQLSSHHQRVVKEIARRYCSKLVKLTRKDNGDAKKLLGEQYLEFVRPTSQQVAKFEKDAQSTYKRSIPGLYPRSLFDQIQNVLNTARNKHP
jgi:TRAP-type C4-dicarboxylate transport system substrate-binding protein